MKKAIMIGMCLALLLSLAACGSAQQETEPTLAPVGIANPYGTYETEQEMEQAAGLEIQLPANVPDWVNQTIYRAIPGELVEIIYKGETNEIRVRMKNGNQDISGVYDSDTGEEKDVTVGDYAVHLKGETTQQGDFTVYVSTWFTQEGRTYSVTSPEGVAEAVMLDVISQIR